MNAPFLDLAYYVGAENVDATLRSIATSASGQKIIGLKHRPEEVCSIGASVVVRTEGEDFCGGTRANNSRLHRLGQQVSAAFLKLAESIDCLYGAILVEYRLETPVELRHDPRSLAFQNFYLSRRHLQVEVISRCLSAVPKQAYVRELEHGVFVSMSREYNSEGRQVASDLAQRSSVDVGRVIGEGAP